MPPDKFGWRFHWYKDTKGASCYTRSMTNQAEYKRTTVVFPVQEDRILLGMKKRGFGEGWWNGFGGKLDSGETYVASAIRETAEEVELELAQNALRHAADIVFRFDGTVDVVTKAYIATSFSGTPVETEEMKPQWFPLDRIPYSDMWPGDDQWIPKILGKKALLPLGFIIDFTKNNEFIGIESVDSQSLEGYF